MISNEYIPFNINDYVKIKLTEKGKQILKDEHNKLNKYCNGILKDFQLKLDEDGYMTEQLWYIFQTFGEYISMGCDLPFDTEILIQQTHN